MKKQSNKFWAVAALVLAAGAVVAVACTKEVGSDEPEAQARTSKSDTSLEKVESALWQYYNRCDEAYKKDSTAFLSACENADYEEFLSLTGIKDEESEDVDAGIKAVYDKYVELDGEELESSCKDCVESALSRIGRLVALTSGNTADMMKVDFDHADAYADPLARCYARCKQEDDAHKRTACLSACAGEKVALQSVTQAFSARLFQFNIMCNEAFKKDSATFVDACDKYDTNAFMQLTGLTCEFMNVTFALARLGVGIAFDTEQADSTESPCAQCGEKALSPLKYQVLGTRGGLPAPYGDYYCPTTLWNCTKYCLGLYGASAASHSCFAYCNNYLYWKEEGILVDYVD